MKNTACAGCLVLPSEEDSSFSRLLVERLPSHEFEVLVATNGEEAVALAIRFKPSHCILDLPLCKDNRLHLIPALLSIVPHMQIVVVTSYGSVATAVASMKRGAKDYLMKPLRFPDLLEALQGNGLPQEEAIESHEAPPALRRVEWEYIQRILNECDGNISETARRLCMHRRTLQRKLNKRPVPERSRNELIRNSQRV